MTAFTHWITNLLKWSLHHKRVTLGIVLALFVGSLYMVAGGYVGAEFFAKSDRGEFMVQLELPKDASIEQPTRLRKKLNSICAPTGSNRPDHYGRTNQ